MSDYSTILVLGNGFDIEHGLPTKYKDFCEYIDNLKESKAYELERQLASYYHEHIKRALGGKNNCLYSIITEKLKDDDKKYKWVDFEHEIGLFMRYYEDKFYARKNKYDQSIEKNKNSIVPFNVFDPADIDPEKLKEDFFRLRYAFEMYISEVVNYTCSEYWNETIAKIKPDLVISFNYSDTYEKRYGNCKMIYYIHGKADIPSEEAISCPEAYDDRYRANSHIVFGMNEYLEENDRKQKAEFMQFRKYFQRSYRLTEMRFETPLKDARKIYVFGYSMNSEDADLIKEIIEVPDAPTTIYYYDEAAKADILTNLYRVFDRKYVEERYFRGEKPIMLEKQGDRVTRSGLSELIKERIKEQDKGRAPVTTEFVN